MASPSTATSLPACFLPPFPLPLEAPVALDGVDISLATEVLPAPPPLFVPNSKRPSDYLRKKVLPSYLPSTDPGSTYNAGTGVTVIEDASLEEETADQGSKRKRQRTEKAENSRPQQVTHDANPTIHPLPSYGTSPPPMEVPNGPEVIQPPSTSLQPEGIADPPRSNIPPHVSGARSRRSSGLLAASRLSQLDWSVNGNSIAKRKGVDGQDLVTQDIPIDFPDGGKGKGKEVGPPNDEHANSTECSTCGMSLLFTPSGALYCDGCPRSFHLCCLEPPLDQGDLEKGEWFCTKCKAERGSIPLGAIIPAGSAGLFTELINTVSKELPSTYILPEDIRNHFRDVGMTTDGAYIDVGELRGLKSGLRPTIIEEREPYHLKNRQGLPATCYKCGTSANPTTDLVSSPKFEEQITLTSMGTTRRRSHSVQLQRSITDDSGAGSSRGGASTISDPFENGSFPPMDGYRFASPTSQSSVPSAPSEASHSQGPLSDAQASGTPATNAEPAVTRRRSSRRPMPVSKDRAPRPITTKVEPMEPVWTTNGHDRVAPGLRLNHDVTRSGWKAMIACDYCMLSWHLDCLDPPQVCLPPAHKKWMCPNHVEHALPKRRIPKQLKTVTLTINSTSSGSRRPSYNIEVIPNPEESPVPVKFATPGLPTPRIASDVTAALRGQKRKRPSTEHPAKLVPDSVASGIKYRKPEQSIRVDFWKFAKKPSPWRDRASSAATSQLDRAALFRERARRTLSSTSSLSSLSSSSDSEDDVDREQMQDVQGQAVPPLSDVQLAVEGLMGLKFNHMSPRRNSTAVQTTDLEGSSTYKFSAPPPTLKQTVRTALQIKETQSSTDSVLSSPTKSSSSSSFKIRIPGLASRVANNAAAASTKPTSPRRSARIPPSVAPTPYTSIDNSSRNTLASTPSTQPSQTVPTGLSNDELKSLLAVRELLKAKGEKELMEWLKS